MSGASRWGWHRLDREAAERLVAEAELPRGALVLDVGAGDGVITAALLAAGCRVVAVELHPERAALLHRRFGDAATIVRADAADLRLPRRPFHVVANPPFAVGSALLRRLLAPNSRMVSARVVLQDQVARRWGSAGAPGRRRWGSHYQLSVGPRIPRQAFHPPPRVNARILEIRALPGPQPRSGTQAGARPARRRPR